MKADHLRWLRATGTILVVGKRTTRARRSTSDIGGPELAEEDTTARREDAIASRPHVSKPGTS